ncbi:UbiA family prenyltransferase [Natronorarus salvus]|uniref:UbiA family prenyltransferase n=1 Tax=Natronorarus salvus TaxID=3117733 RepID=UPI002F261B50
MRFARHGTGLRADLAALASQVHPVFMLPPLASSWFGSMLSGQFSLALGTLHMTAIFLAVYTAHVKDGYVDFHMRSEDDDHPITEPGCRLALLSASGAFFACLVLLWLSVDLWAALLTLPTWLIAYNHAPRLDMHPLGATMGYPAGIALAIVGGYYAQTTTLSTVVLAFALVFLVLLTGIKVIDDEDDYAYDRSIGKRSVAVVLGPGRARDFAYGLMGLSLALVTAFALLPVFPVESLGAVLAFGVVAGFARRSDDPTLATMLLVRGAYVFLALLLAAVYFRPLGW